MRIWNNRSEDDGTVQVLGNGRLCVYAQGPDLIQVFGPPYSAPSLYGLALDEAASVSVSSDRLPGAAIWTHRVSVAGTAAGDWVDFVDAEIACLVRHLRLTCALRFKLTLHVPAVVIDNGSRLEGAGGGLLLQVPPGQNFYGRYPFPGPIFHQIAWRGEVSATRGEIRATLDEGNRTVDLVCQPGETWLFLTGGPDYPAAIESTGTALRAAPELLLARTQRRWQGYTGSRRDRDATLPAEIPHRAQLLRACDDVAVLIRAQQAAEGGVLAGYPYHMGYVRDQYGVSRGLLALGHSAQARAIVDYYWGIWQHHGCIHNAQALGVDGAFHIHENDDVEITGYLIRQAFDLAECCGEEVLDEVFPMLEWAWEAQKPHLVLDMLPFNGDETYVAGGILPRTALNDGSAEATLLFCDGGARLLDWIARRDLWPDDRLAENRGILQQVRAHYRANFWRDGQLVTNNPQRATAGTPPRYRHGVCERCMAEGRFRGIEWTERSATGRYLCPSCLAAGSYPTAEPATYVLPSVALTPLYFRSDLLPADDLRPIVEQVVPRFLPQGAAAETLGSEAGTAVGYDYGFLLYALTELRHPLAPALVEATLARADAAGAWAEYYRDGKPAGTRCRPWESAISVEALLHWACHDESPNH